MKKFLIALSLLLTSFAQAETAKNFIERLEAISTLSGNFKQTITDADGEEAGDSTTGDFYLKRPGKFYWHTAPPFEQVVVGNERGLIVHDPDLAQVTVYDRAEFLSSPAAVLSGDGKSIEEKYSITASVEKKEQRYVLKEKDQSNKSFETLTFVFVKNSLTSLTLVDQLGQRTSIRFDKVQENQPVKDDLFVFVPPEGVDIIVNK
jgi:outer membrane lipoprotein carrier protein